MKGKEVGEASQAGKMRQGEVGKIREREVRGNNTGIKENIR